MLKRLYIDNYKACVNFDIEFDALNLFVGENGTGKSTVLDVLRKLQLLLMPSKLGAPSNSVEDLFPMSTLTRWQTSKQQKFELELEGYGGIYKYTLVVVHGSDSQDTEKSRTRIEDEVLLFNNQLLLDVTEGGGTINHDGYQDGGEGARTFSLFDKHRSSIPVIRSNFESGYPKITWFCNRMSDLLIVQINPWIDAYSNGHAPVIDYHAANFATWYRQASQDQGFALDIQTQLREILNEFHSFNYAQLSNESHRFEVRFGKRGEIVYNFDELSEGQKTLIILYTFLFYSDKTPQFTLCIDEPENFVDLSEIQPWIDDVYDRCIDGELQAILISHHPSYIDNLASSVGIYFAQDDAERPIRIKQLDTDNVLPISVLMQRGRLDE